jgi:hypothetical protein
MASNKNQPVIRFGALAQWGHYQAIGAALTLLCGGIVTVTVYPRWYVGAYAIGVAFGVMIVEGVHSYDAYCKTEALRIVYAQPLFRAVLYAILSPGCFFEVPTIDGGIFLSLSALTMAIAAAKSITSKKSSGAVAPN